MVENWDKIGIELVGGQSIILLIVGLVVGSGIGYGSTFTSYAPQLNAARSEVQALEAQLTRLAGATEVELPPEVIQLSPVVPMMGAHWANPNDLPLGPIYLLTDDGKLLGIEYMYIEDMLSEITVPGPEGPETLFGLTGLPVSIPELSIEKVASHIDVALMPHGHEGFEAEHWEMG